MKTKLFFLTAIISAVYASTAFAGIGNPLIAPQLKVTEKKDDVADKEKNATGHARDGAMPAPAGSLNSFQTPLTPNSPLGQPQEVKEVEVNLDDYYVSAVYGSTAILRKIDLALNSTSSSTPSGGGSPPQPQFQPPQAGQTSTTSKNLSAKSLVIKDGGVLYIRNQKLNVSIEDDATVTISRVTPKGDSEYVFQGKVESSGVKRVPSIPAEVVNHSFSKNLNSMASAASTTDASTSSTAAPTTAK